jgi:hypothetical protein
MFFLIFVCFCAGGAKDEQLNPADITEIIYHLAGFELGLQVPPVMVSRNRSELFH